MKSIFVIFIVIFVKGTVLSQEYKFNELIQFKDSISKNIEFFMINTDKNDYYFHASNYGQDSIVGSIYDFKSGKKHDFNLSNLNKKIVFEKKETFDIQFKNYTYRKYYYTEKKEILPNGKIKISLMSFNNKKKKKMIFTTELLCSNNVNIVSSYFINFFTHGFFLNTDYQTYFNFPEEIHVIRKNKIITKYSIIEKKTIDTSLSVN